MNNISYTGVILSGGNSKRMGTDKAFVTYGEKLLIQHAIEKLIPFCEHLILSANTDRYNAFNLPVISDSITDIGPMGGIYSILKISTGNRFLFCPCDIPDISPQLFTKMTEAGKNSDAVILLSPSGKLQPLPIVLTKRCIPYLEKQINNENYKLQCFCKELIEDSELDVIQIKLNEELKNINRPEDILL